MQADQLKIFEKMNFIFGNIWRETIFFDFEKEIFLKKLDFSYLNVPDKKIKLLINGTYYFFCERLEEGRKVIELTTWIYWIGWFFF